MMTPNEALGASLIVIIAVVAAYLAYNFHEDRKIRREDRRQRAQWESDVAETDLPAWDGATYDWPETGLARYLDAASWQPQFYQAPYETPAPAFIPATGPQPLLLPAPVSDTATPGFTPAADTAWQPLSVYKPPSPPPMSDTDLYIAMIKARTDAYITHLGKETSALLALPSAGRLAVTA